MKTTTKIIITSIAIIWGIFTLLLIIKDKEDPTEVAIKDTSHKAITFDTTSVSSPISAANIEICEIEQARYSIPFVITNTPEGKKPHISIPNYLLPYVKTSINGDKLIVTTNINLNDDSINGHYIEQSTIYICLDSVNSIINNSHNDVTIYNLNQNTLYINQRTYNNNYYPNTTTLKECNIRYLNTDIDNRLIFHNSKVDNFHFYGTEDNWTINSYDNHPNDYLNTP